MKKNVLVAVLVTGLCVMALVIGIKIVSASLTVNTNVASLEAQKALAKTQSSLQASFNRISTGMRLNSASDDAEGLAISENLRAQINVLKRSMRNVSEGVSLLQISEEAFTGVSDILTKMDDTTGGYEELLKELAQINKKITTKEDSLTKVKLINKPVSDIIKDAKEALTKKTLTKKQRRAKIDAALIQIEKRKKDVILYATSVDKAGRNTILSAEAAWDMYSR
ncbi:MAG: hypothetical protein AAB606_00990 [Patescibacteria group bacterium]